MKERESSGFDKVAIAQPFRPVYPSPAGLITSVDGNGKPNIITLGEIFNISISRPVIIGIAIRPATYSHDLIVSSGEFVVNLPSSSIAEKVLKCGSVSGRSGIDKFEYSGLTPLPATVVKPPLIGECPVNLECKVVGVNTVGDHDLILGQLMVQHADVELLDDEGHICPEKLNGFSMFLGEFWSMGKRIAKHY